MRSASCEIGMCSADEKCGTERGEGGSPPIDVGNGVTTESAPNIWRWRTAVEHHAGIDVSLELSSVCVVDGRGKIVREAKVASEPDALVSSRLFGNRWLPQTTCALLLDVRALPPSAPAEKA